MNYAKKSEQGGEYYSPSNPYFLIKTTMTKVKGAYDCSYCHGDPDHACTACDPECDCIEILEEQEDEAEEAFSAKMSILLKALK